MKRLVAMLLSAAMVSPLTAPSAALAQHHRGHSSYQWQGDRNSKWDPAQHYHAGNYRARRLTRNDRIYRGNDGRYYCRRSDGTTGLVVGTGGGGLLGRSIDQGNVTCR
jgi:hypothetical protein